MRVHVLHLFEAIRKTAWRHGFFAPERVRHQVTADGSHRIELTLAADEVEYKPPKPPLTGAALLGTRRVVRATASQTRDQDAVSRNAHARATRLR